ncbi:MAG TPA: DUF4912 domain-containing protein [Firmicutes bacterium]|nr:DUF4912 domain-containing protein [Bacillota bacterium]
MLHAPLPVKYGITRIHLMPIDPHHLYAYWEITDEFRELVARHFRCSWQQMPLLLRLYSANEMGENLTIVQETEISDSTDNWFFNRLAAGRNYVADLGTRNIYGIFVALLRSNYVMTPRNWPGRSVRRPVISENWLPEKISSSYHQFA